MANRNKLPEGLVRRGNGYYAHFTVDGKRIRKLLSHDLRTAKMLLIELRARVQRGEHLLADVPSDTFEADADLPSGIRVYFLEAIGIEKIKIGVSGNLRNRLKQLENASPVPVRAEHECRRTRRPMRPAAASCESIAFGLRFRIERLD